MEHCNDFLLALKTMQEKSVCSVTSLLLSRSVSVINERQDQCGMQRAKQKFGKIVLLPEGLLGRPYLAFSSASCEWTGPISCLVTANEKCGE
jgi:hypothetical protein